MSCTSTVNTGKPEFYTAFRDLWSKNVKIQALNLVGFRRAKLLYEVVILGLEIFIVNNF